MLGGNTCRACPIQCASFAERNGLQPPGQGDKASGIGRETHKMALAKDQQTKCLLVSYSPNKLGFF